MPRAYRPRLSTSSRASVAAKNLCATSWHLFKDKTRARSGEPALYLVMPDGSRATITLKEAETPDALQLLTVRRRVLHD